MPLTTPVGGTFAFLNNEVLSTKSKDEVSKLVHTAIKGDGVQNHDAD